MLLRFLERHVEEHGMTTLDARKAFYVPVYCFSLVRHRQPWEEEVMDVLVSPTKTLRTLDTLLWWHLKLLRPDSKAWFCMKREKTIYIAHMLI